MYCKNCTYWEQENKVNVSGIDTTVKNIGSCHCPMFVMGYYHSAYDIKADQVWVEDDEGWGFYTGKLFGCIHFTQKNESSGKK